MQKDSPGCVAVADESRPTVSSVLRPLSPFFIAVARVVPGTAYRIDVPKGNVRACS